MNNPFKVGDIVTYHSEKCSKSFYKSAKYYCEYERDNLKDGNNYKIVSLSDNENTGKLDFVKIENKAWSLPYDVFTLYKEKDKFVLPEEWEIMRDKNNYLVINAWMNKHHNREPKNYGYYEDDHGIVNNVNLHKSCSKEYTEITFEQFKEYVLNQPKQETMKKEDFTIEGSEALKKAFVEESGLTDNYLTPWNTSAYMCARAGGQKGFDAVLLKGSTRPNHFVLPQDWDKALQYVKEFFEEPKYKVGDWVISTQKFMGAQQILKIDDVGDYVLSKQLNTFAEDVVRLATPKEIESAKTKTFKLGEYTAVVDKDKVTIDGRGSLTHGQCIELVDKLRLKSFTIGGFEIHGREMLVHIGCVKNVPFKDMVKVYDYLIAQLPF